MYYRCLQLAWWLLEYNPLWGEGVLAGPLHSALMWAPFDFLFIFLWFFEQRFPHFSMEGFWKDFHLHWIAPMYWQGTMWRHEKWLNYTQLYIDIYKFKQIKWKTTLQANFISSLRNKCDTMITAIFVNWTICNKIPSLGTCVVSLIAKSYGAI